MKTIGHSTLPLEVFLRALVDNGVRTLVDVRRYPGSRRNPQYSQRALFAALTEERIEGIWREGLGGHRQPLAESINLGWRHDSFRGYADYMQTIEFAAHLDWLLALPGEVAIMCAESHPLHCHRSLIADALLARGHVVEHILVDAPGSSRLEPHRLTSFARIEDGRLWYPPPHAVTLFD
ncbi:MAG TPA: DUF488 domain-containing protein [Granulicella sp.]